MTQAGIDLVKSFEGCRLTAYQDDSPARLWTVGYGSTHEVTPGMVITAEDAESRLAADLETIALLVKTYLRDTELEDNQFSAVVSFCFNVGFGKDGVKDGFACLAAGGPSTMLKCLLQGDINGASEEFPKWDKIGGAVSAGILRRRMAEKALFDGLA
jgi:lysozyme